MATQSVTIALGIDGHIRFDLFIGGITLIPKNRRNVLTAAFSSMTRERFEPLKRFPFGEELRDEAKKLSFEVKTKLSQMSELGPAKVTDIKVVLIPAPRRQQRTKPVAGEPRLPKNRHLL